jgi:hypothetical protein
LLRLRHPHKLGDKLGDNVASADSS